MHQQTDDTHATIEKVMQVLENLDDHPKLKELSEQLDRLHKTFRVDGRWQLEGFVMFFYRLHRLAREVDPSIYRCMPEH